MIYLIRHGLDDERYIGGYSNASLIKEGVEQIIKVKDYIVDNNISITKIYSSDITRARETANIINQALNKEIIYISTLRELDKGLLTGLKKELAYEQFPEYKDLTDISKRYPNGESMQDLYDRIVKFINQLSEDNILLVTHRGVINIFYYYLTNTPLDMDKEKFGVNHGSIHEFDIKRKSIRKIF